MCENSEVDSEPNTG